MSLQKANSAWQRRLFDGPTGPKGEIAKFDDLQAIITALTAKAHSEGGSLEKDVYQWYVDQLKNALQRLWECDDIFNTPEKQGSSLYNKLWDRLLRARVILIALGEMGWDDTFSGK